MLRTRAGQDQFGRPRGVHPITAPSAFLFTIIIGSIWPPRAWSIWPPSDRLSQERSFRFVVVGGAPLQWKGVNLDQREWTLVTEKADLNEMDVGVMPLVDTPWTRGKCGFKLIQYMASGACAVASPVGANLAILTSETGCFAETPADWLRTLRDLLDDGSLRARLARSARSRVEREFSLARWLPTIAGVLQNAATAKGA